MTVKRKIQVYLSVLIICVAIISVAFVERNVVTKRTELAVNKISQVTSETILLSRLTKNYVSSPSAVAEKEWLAKYELVQQLLSDPGLSEHRSHPHFQELVQINNTVKAIFAQLSRELNNQSVRERLGSQILFLTENFAVVSSNVERNIFSEAENSQHNTTIFLLISFAVIFAIMVSIWLLIIRQISVPITELTTAVNRIDGGDFSARAPSKAQDEIGTLGRAFNNMVQKLKDRTKDLRDANAKDESLLRNLDKRVVELEEAKKAIANLLEDVEVDRRVLLEAKAKDDALLENIGDGLLVIDKDKKIRVFNKAAENLLGVHRSEAIGEVYTKVFDCMDAYGNIVPDERRPLSLVLSSGSKITTTVFTPQTTSLADGSSSPPLSTVYYVRKDGTNFPVALTITPVIVNGEIIGVVDIFRDVTKELEIENLRIDFLSLASHQLRTPLSGIKWLIETIRRGITGATNKKQKEYLDQIYQANERMILLVSDMLEVLKLESSAMVLKKEKFLVSKFYSELVSTANPLARKSDITLKNMVPSDSKLIVTTDLQMLRVCMQNFVSNAINYSRPGREVVIDATEQSSMTVLTVKDNGIGIPEVEKHRIFERFYRASNAKEFVPGGTGLGLYRASLFAKKIGAKISFESEEGEGTTFYISIPKEREGVV